jgi:hypothetical protein
MRRNLALIAAMVMVGLVGTGCQRSVEVQTGATVTCTYGHQISDDVKTVKVPAKSASAYRVRKETRTCERHLALEALYAEAQTALAAGDTKLADEKLAQVVKDDPKFGRATQQRAAIARGEKPAPDTSTSPPANAAPSPDDPAAVDDAKPGDGDTSGPIGALEKYVPATLAGYTGQRAGADALVISRNYVPEGDSQAVLLVIQAEQFRTAAEAKSALEGVMRFVTARSESSQQISGHAVKLGDNGRDSSFAAFTDGSILVSMEIAAKSGVDPSKLKDDLVDVIKALP